MAKIWDKITGAYGCLILIVLLVLLSPLILLRILIGMPIDYIRYRCSLYYKEVGGKYTDDLGYRIYKYVRENPHLRMLRDENGDSYIKGERAVLLLADFYSFTLVDGEWRVLIGDEEGTRSAEILQALREDHAPGSVIAGELEQHAPLFLVCEDNFESAEHMEKAKDSPLFLFIEDDEAWRTVCF